MAKIDAGDMERFNTVLGDMVARMCKGKGWRTHCLRIYTDGACFYQDPEF